MHRSLVWLVFPAVLVALLLATPGSSAQAANTKGGKAPEIAITDGINGVTAKTTLADYKESPTLLVIWLPICPHCAKFMPEVHRLHQKYGSKGLKVLTISNGKKEYTAKYLADRGWSFGVGFDWTGTTSARYGLTGLPGKYLIGADGNLRTWNGTLEQAIVDELPQPASPK